MNGDGIGFQSVEFIMPLFATLNSTHLICMPSGSTHGQWWIHLLLCMWNRLKPQNIFIKILNAFQNVNILWPVSHRYGCGVQLNVSSVNNLVNTNNTMFHLPPYPSRDLIYSFAFCTNMENHLCFDIQCDTQAISTSLFSKITYKKYLCKSKGIEHILAFLLLFCGLGFTVLSSALRSLVLNQSFINLFFKCNTFVKFEYFFCLFVYIF